MGHSQGGLLTKLTVIDSGNAFWENVTDKPFDEVRLEPETKGSPAQSAVRRAAALRSRGDLPRHAAPRQLPRRTAVRAAPGRVLRADAEQPGPRQRGLGGRRADEHARALAEPDADQHRQHVAGPSLHQGARQDSGEAAGDRPLDHLGRQRRAARPRRRRRGEVQERPPKARRVRADREEPALRHAGRALRRSKRCAASWSRTPSARRVRRRGAERRLRLLPCALRRGRSGRLRDRPVRGLLRHHLLTRPRLLHAVDDHALAGGEPLADLLHAVVDDAERDAARLDRCRRPSPPARSCRPARPAPRAAARARRRARPGRPPPRARTRRA